MNNTNDDLKNEIQNLRKTVCNLQNSLNTIEMEQERLKLQNKQLLRSLGKCHKQKSAVKWI